jgi:lysophospholipase L1-like esterase
VKKFLCVLIILFGFCGSVSAATIEGDSLTVGTKPYSTCKTNAWVGRFSRSVNIRPGIIIATGANDGVLSPRLAKAARASGVQWASIFLPGRPGQTNKFNSALRKYGLGYPDWNSYAKTLPAKAWSGIHMTPYGYKLRAAFFNQYC